MLQNFASIAFCSCWCKLSFVGSGILSENYNKQVTNRVNRRETKRSRSLFQPALKSLHTVERCKVGLICAKLKLAKHEFDSNSLVDAFLTNERWRGINDNRGVFSGISNSDSVGKMQSSLKSFDKFVECKLLHHCIELDRLSEKLREVFCQFRFRVSMCHLMYR